MNVLNLVIFVPRILRKNFGFNSGLKSEEQKLCSDEKILAEIFVRNVVKVTNRD